MLLAAGLMITGFLGTAFATHRRGYRLGGAAVVGILAVYSLTNVATVPMFVGNTLLAYFALSTARHWTLVSGRDEFVIVVAAGVVVPLTVIGWFWLFVGPIPDRVLGAAVVGSVLPGLAAYNFHRIDPEKLGRDVVAMAGFAATLFVVGDILVSAAPPLLAGSRPAILFSSTADVAMVRGVAVNDPPPARIAARPLLALFFLAGFVLSELVRRYDYIRIGIVSVSLVAIYTLADWRLPVLFAAVVVILFPFYQAVHRRTLLYGRVLLGVGTAVGVALAAGLGSWAGIDRGISLLFVGVLAGVNGYFVHATSPHERTQLALVGTAAYLNMVVIAALVVDALPGGYPQELTPALAASAGLVAALLAGSAELLRPTPPNPDEVRKAARSSRWAP